VPGFLACVARVHVGSERNSGHAKESFAFGPLPFTFLLSPQFSRGPNAKNSFEWPEFRSLRTGTLATQATGSQSVGRIEKAGAGRADSFFLPDPARPAPAFLIVPTATESLEQATTRLPWLF